MKRQAETGDPSTISITIAVKQREVSKDRPQFARGKGKGKTENRGWSLRGTFPPKLLDYG